MKKILITGAKGFLGSNIANHFAATGYETYGIGHNKVFIPDEKKINFLHFWSGSDITVEAIKDIGQVFDTIVHCGSGSSVGFSNENPYEDFKKTVNGTLEVLEYMRLHNPFAQLIYPSSPAVQGEHADAPIKEDYTGKPVSPYGYNKKIAEDLCLFYSKKYGIKTKIIRLFSVYGKGLRKQLLWDACKKFLSGQDTVEFWGTGNETRDFIHIDDVLSLIDAVMQIDNNFIIFNGGSGSKHLISEVVLMIKTLIGSDAEIIFNNKTNTGNPAYYWADISKAAELGWSQKINFKEGLKEYIKWAKTTK